jgi:sialate O-acetylesterase
MHRHTRFRWISLVVFAFVGCALPTARAAAKVSTDRAFLSPVFADHMVLQRDKPNRFWGWTVPGKMVSVDIGGVSATTTAGTDGKWQLESKVPAAGGPYEVIFSGPQTVTLKDVLVGDVWLCSGQSNMGITLAYSTGGAEAANQANEKDLRFCTVAAANAYAPAAVAACTWTICTPKTAASFSAVAYYFARRLQQDVKIPIGLIFAAVGGSPAESWMSAESLERIGEFKPQLKEIARLNQRPGERFGSFLMHWLEEYDQGGRNAAWAQPGESEAGWKPVQIPGGFAGLGVAATPAVCWFRRTITLPADYKEGAGKLFLGEVEKMDTTYINGRWIGASSWVENPRAYVIPAGILHAGANVIAIRVFKIKPNGGFQSSAATLQLQLADGSSLALAGSWLGRLSVDARPPIPWPLDLENYATMPTVLYNGMIAPLDQLALTGVIWYQGEANQTRPNQYAKLLPALIANWRQQFAQGDIPFYIAGLPAFMVHRDQPGSFDGWTGVREAQAKTVHAVANTGLAITVDTGDAANIHPHEKRAVGERLALLALAGNYHQPVVAAGPIYRSLQRNGSELRLKFDGVSGGIVSHGKELAEFSVAGADHKWHWAHARIDGDTVVVSSPEVPSPVAARYAWQANPVATLFNTAGLPAAPFRTDNWPSEPDR